MKRFIRKSAQVPVLPLENSQKNRTEFEKIKKASAFCSKSFEEKSKTIKKKKKLKNKYYFLIFFFFSLY